MDFSRKGKLLIRLWFAGEGFFCGFVRKYLFVSLNQNHQENDLRFRSNSVR